MERKIQFQKNAGIINEKGEQVGLLERVVLNPQTKVVTDLVVRTGSLFNKQEKVVPVTLVKATAEHFVILNDDTNGLNDLPLFEIKRTLSDWDDNGLDQEFREEPRSADAASPIVYGNALGTPVFVPRRDERFTTSREQNIPEGTVAMKEGARVIAAEGKQIGQVESVLADPEIDQVTHLLVSRGLFTKETKLIPIQWVEVLGEDEVYLRVGKSSVEGLEQEQI